MPISQLGIHGRTIRVVISPSKGELVLWAIPSAKKAYVSMPAPWHKAQAFKVE